MIKNIFLKTSSIIVAAILLYGCSSVQKSAEEKASAEHEAFFAKKGKGRELFRVLISSEKYSVVQMKNEETIARAPDEGGDKYICSEIAALNKIDEVREGVISIWLFPDTGRLMKVRIQQPTFLVEIDRILTEDIQRWNFTFPKRTVDPTSFDIRYRVVLKKTLSDEEIIKEVQDKMREGN